MSIVMMAFAIVCRLFTVDAYYLYDIIDGNPVAIERIPLDEKNKSRILAFDKKYKREIYRGTRSIADWVNRFRTEYVGVFSGDNGAIGSKGSNGSGLDVSRDGGEESSAFERVGTEKISEVKRIRGRPPKPKNKLSTSTTASES